MEQDTTMTSVVDLYFLIESIELWDEFRSLDT